VQSFSDTGHEIVWNPSTRRVRVEKRIGVAVKVFDAHGIEPQWDLAVPKSWLADFYAGRNWGPALEPANRGYGISTWQRQVFQLGIGTYAGSSVSWQHQPAGVKQPWLYQPGLWRPIAETAAGFSQAVVHQRPSAATAYLGPTLARKAETGCLQEIIGFEGRPSAFSSAIRLWNDRSAAAEVRYSVGRSAVTDRMVLGRDHGWRITSVVRGSSRSVACPAWSPPTNAFPGTYAVGDSVMVDAQPYLQQMGITVDAAVSRQFDTGIAILQQLKSEGRLPSRVVIGLGTNGPMTQDDLDAALTMLDRETRVVVLTVREPRWWEAQVNAVVRAGVRRFKNARIADWHAASAGHPEYFAGDGIHLTSAGALVWAHVVANALGEP